MVGVTVLSVWPISFLLPFYILVIFDLLLWIFFSSLRDDDFSLLTYQAIEAWKQNVQHIEIQYNQFIFLLIILILFLVIFILII
jgi:hypothetical protein